MYTKYTPEYIVIEIKFGMLLMLADNGRTEYYY